MHQRSGCARKIQRGSAIPAVLALTMGVGALTAAYVSRNLREHTRESFDRESEQALYDAWSQLQVATRILNASLYDGAGHNMALRAALARPDAQFIDTDGWPTGVTVTPEGTTDYFRLVSTAAVGGVTTRVSALCTERESFANFNTFVATHPLGISGGGSAVFPYSDAPEGSVHSNDRVVFYFPDRHFRDPVTAANGFEYMAGAIGPGDGGQNTWFHGTVNDHAEAITGLSDVDVGAFATRSDTLLALTGDFDYAKVKLRGTTAHVEHWQASHTELQDVLVWQEQFHYESQLRTVYDYGYVDQEVAVQTPVYGDVQVPVYEQRLVSDAWTETVTTMVQTQVWVEGGGGGDTGGTGGTGSVGYWDTQLVPTTTTVEHPAVYEQVQVGTTTETGIVGYTTTYQTQPVWQVVGSHEETVSVKVTDGWTQVTQQQYVSVADHKVADHDLTADGTVYVRGAIKFVPMTNGADGQDVQLFDRRMTFASGSNVYLQDSIVYATPDASGALQTRFLNGANKAKDYVPNPAYTGTAVLGILAERDIVYTSDLPNQTEINATLLCKNGEVRVQGLQVNPDGTVTETAGGWVKLSLRRLGSLITNWRPVSSYVDSSNTVTRGFVYAKSRFDSRQRINPPIGFPTLTRPRVVATVVKEVN
jgi:hypothetical protein